jgi:hypothetical protein
MHLITYWNWKEATMLAKLLDIVGYYNFVINDEGSISPRFAPHLCIGASIAGSANQIDSSEHMELARSESLRQYRFWNKTFHKVVFMFVRIILILCCISINLNLMRPYTKI